MATYNLDQVSCSLAGIPVLGGWGEGESLTIKRNSEIYENTVGRGGHVVRSRTNDQTGTVEITLLQTDPVNTAFAALARLDENTPHGAGIGTFQSRDRENGDEYVAGKAWIQAWPDTDFARKAGDRTWMVYCEKLEFFPGGRP
jgi:hypothetical protein